MGELYSKYRAHTTTSTCDSKIMFTHNTFIQKYELIKCKLCVHVDNKFDCSLRYQYSIKES